MLALRHKSVGYASNKANNFFKILS